MLDNQLISRVNRMPCRDTRRGLVDHCAGVDVAVRGVIHARIFN